jgi:hypothetical protein
VGGVKVRAVVRIVPPRSRLAAHAPAADPAPQPVAVAPLVEKATAHRGLVPGVAARAETQDTVEKKQRVQVRPAPLPRPRVGRREAARLAHVDAAFAARQRVGDVAFQRVETHLDGLVTVVLGDKGTALCRSTQAVVVSLAVTNAATGTESVAEKGGKERL